MTAQEEQLHLKIHELEKQVQRLQVELKKNSETQYGLRWMNVPEAFETESENKIPTLEEVKELAIDNNDGKPTHILIEGDNYHALTCLNYTHKGKVDVIYIDPPYNTGSDGFVYKDKRVLDKFPDGTVVPKDHPLRHSYWLSFMSKRLELAKNLLSDKGVIFISIDDNEDANLKLLCDQIFGNQNKIADIIWQSRKSVSNDTFVSNNHNYTLVYAKRLSSWNMKDFRLPLKSEKFANPDNDPRGNWVADPFDAPNIRPNLTYPIVNPNTGEEFWPPKGRHWRTTQESYFEYLADNRIIFGKSGKSKPQLKRFESEAESNGETPTSIWTDVETTTDGTKLLMSIFNGAMIFSNPKPIGLIERLLQLVNKSSAVILDFFAGSGTTMHATMALNQEDGGNRQCILVQSADPTWEEKDGKRIAKKGCEIAFQEGFNYITEITYERNRRVMMGYHNPKGDEINGFGNSMRYYRTSFVGEHHVEHANDADKVALTQKAGCLLALGENTLDEVVTARSYQIFKRRNGDRSANGFEYTAIYFSGNLLQFGKFREEIEKLQASEDHPRIAVYVFCWGDATIFENEFDDLKGLTIKPIPQPILEIYQDINNL